MKYYIITSDKYNLLLEGYAKLFNHFWDSTIDVTILGFSRPDLTLPSNFKFHSMGKQSDWDTWSGPLIEYFNSIDDEYIFICFEDHYITDTVNTVLFNEALSYCDGSIDKVYLMIENRTITSDYKGNFFNSQDSRGANVNNSLLPAIWKRNFFMKLLDSNIKTAHDFEAVNNKQLGGNIIQSQNVIYPNVDCARKGNFNQPVFTEYNESKSYNCGAYRQHIQEIAMPVFYDMYNKWMSKYER